MRIKKLIMTNNRWKFSSIIRTFVFHFSPIWQISRQSGMIGRQATCHERRRFIRQIRFLTVTLIESERWKVCRQPETRTSSLRKNRKIPGTVAGNAVHARIPSRGEAGNRPAWGWRCLLTNIRRCTTLSQDKCTLTRITSYSVYRRGPRVIIHHLIAKYSMRFRSMLHDNVQDFPAWSMAQESIEPA